MWKKICKREDRIEIILEKKIDKDIVKHNISKPTFLSFYNMTED